MITCDALYGIPKLFNAINYSSLKINNLFYNMQFYAIQNKRIDIPSRGWLYFELIRRDSNFEQELSSNRRKTESIDTNIRPDTQRIRISERLELA